MATQMFLAHEFTTPYDDCRSYPQPSNGNLGTSKYWTARPLFTSRDTHGTYTTPNLSTVLGPTAGFEFNPQSAGAGNADAGEWISAPLAAAVTISGTVTFNIWGSESSMNANAGFQVIVERLDNLGQVVSTIVNSERGTEMGTSAAVNNWTATPTSTNMSKGDRIRVRVLINDAGGTMASGFTCSMVYGASSAGVSGDTYVQFNENLTFMSKSPSGTKMWLKSTAGPAVGADTEYEMWTDVTQIAAPGNVVSVTNQQAGPVTPFRCTVTAGGAAVEWYSKQLNAFTLSGVVLCFISQTATENQGSSCMRCEIAVCNGDGSGATVYGTSTSPIQNGNGQFGGVVGVAGPDISVTDGQRIRLRVYLEDYYSAMVVGSTNTVSIEVEGNTALDDGDSYVTLSQSVTEYVPALAIPPDLLTARHTPRRRLHQRI